ncbi:hypothetical protein [Clostridium estertheticum]|uniref:Uncharacterized protein n=1 Tax=Clostridium estertheticum subsp. estertheticum TaxID=1552 RepID=A0A1J0GC52_9CLOT|nr:hypothetical protein [Clostridium estertheticum]APC38879.1 hypothetical protein A7L45_01745 [Clostridium estertheticum subsp. estertheticum]MBZ9615177.1 hypothetical protein [Clostridium estertheticum subsp. laramiense]WAG75070.1 hypothetical protein LL032_06360 [Clostridium estertheticum]
MFKFFEKDDIEKILNNKRIQGTNEEKLERIRHVDETEALLVRFERMINFTYKNRKSLILHYPSKKINNELMIKEGLKKKVPLIGNIFLSKESSRDIIPFAECVINGIFLPEELAIHWNKMFEIKLNDRRGTLYNIYNENIKKELEENAPQLNEAFELLFQQFNYSDKQLEKIIKLTKNNKVHTGDSALLWIRCDVLEYYTSSHIILDNHKVSYFEYLSKYKYYPHSVAYGLTKREYYKFRQSMIKASDYCVSEEAIRKSFVFLDETDKLKALKFQSRYKVFSEEAWRDLLCKEQFIYTDNLRNNYLILLHLILENKYNKKFTLIDYDTEVRCFNDTNRGKKYYIDAYLHFYIAEEQRNVRYYIEFKNYERTMYEDDKDYLHQPKAILNNNFDIERYKHDDTDIWYYMAITKGSPYVYGKNSVKDSGIQLDNYIDFTWTEVFSIIEINIQAKARESIDRSLGGFLKFIERI